MNLNDIALETWLVLAAIGLVGLMLGVLLMRRPQAEDGFAADEAERLRAERDEWQDKAEVSAEAAASLREQLARLESAAEERDRLRAKLETLSQDRDALARDHASLKAAHEAALAHHTDKLAELEKARERLTEQFKLTANEILKASGAELNKQSMENSSKK